MINGLLVSAPKKILYVCLCNYMYTCLCSRVCTHSMNFLAQNILCKLILHEIYLHNRGLCSLFKILLIQHVPFVKMKETHKKLREEGTGKRTLFLFIPWPKLYKMGQLFLLFPRVYTKMFR